jgi:hypothetical protein
MEFLLSNWLLFVILIAAIAVGGYTVYVFMKRPTDEQLAKVKEWLLYAVAAAEKELGSGTGQIKLRYVYDMFIVKFPYLAKTVSFESFSVLVDEVLYKFKELLNSNDKLKDYIEK